MITSSDDVLALVVAALLGPDAAAQSPSFATNAGPRVFSPRDWPTQPGQFPIIKAWVLRDAMQSAGRSGAPSFTVTTTIAILAEVSALAKLDDAGAAEARIAAAAIDRQIRVAVINSYPLMSVVQQIARIDAQFVFRAAEAHFAGVQITMDVEWFAQADIFAPISTVPLTGVDVDVSTFEPTGLSIDLPQ